MVREESSMRMLKVLLAISFAFNSPLFAADKPAPASAVKRISPVVIGVRTFNMLKTGNRLFLAMKAGANASDEAYLDKMAEEYKAVALPKATEKNGEIWLQDLSKPIKVENLSKGLFSYDGKVFDVSMKKGIEETIED